MLARPPVTRVEAGHLVVRTEIEVDDGSALEPLEVRVPIGHADLLDPTATPGVLTSVALAAARGEDLHVQGEVDARTAAGASPISSALAVRWGRAPVTVQFDDEYGTPADGDAVGLVLSGGIDSWSTLLDLLDAPTGDRVTHLVSVRPNSPAGWTRLAGELAGIAAELGLEVVEVETSAVALLTASGRDADVDAVALATAGAALQVAARMRRLVVATDHPVGPDLMGPVRTGRTEVRIGGQEGTRIGRVARVLGSPLARRSLRVCEVDDEPGNCGRCVRCLVTMAELVVAGDPDPGVGFGAPLDVERVRHLLLGPEVEPYLAPIIEDLPPEHEELRRAWSDAWEKSNGVQPRPRWGDDAPPALAGASLPQRVAAALRATTGQPAAPAPAPLGWRTGAVPLRPSLGLHDEVRALADTNTDRPHAWAVVEHHVRDEARDGRQADLALDLARHHGAGPTYLPGILWAWLEPPVLDAGAVQQLLRTARTRLWWRADGDLEPLRVLEAVEQGCLPLQVMPGPAARDLARDLPSALVPLAVAQESLPDLDLGPDAVARLFGPVVDHLLAGSAEHDLLTGAYA